MLWKSLLRPMMFTLPPETAHHLGMTALKFLGAKPFKTQFQKCLTVNDPALNEEWVTASLGAFNDPLHRELVLPYLDRALERSVWLRDNRRIFFLPAWLNSFIGAQVSPAALARIDQYLADNPGLPDDVRRRILLPRDQLERVVQVRSRQ